MIPVLLLLAVAGLMQGARSFSTGSGTHGIELSFGFLLLSAFFVGQLVARLGLPRLTGYLIAGILAGPFVLDLVDYDMARSLRMVNGVASCILGLIAGAELDLKKVRPLARALRNVMVFAVIGGMLVLAGVLYLIRPLIPLFDGMTSTQSLAVCVLLGVALIPQSPAVVIAVLSEMKADGPLSQFMLASVVVADLVVILFYSIAAAATGAFIGGGVDAPAMIGSVAWELGGSVVFGVAIGMLIGAFLRTVKQGAAMFALMICVVVAEIGGRVHLDPLVVMLAAGIWLQNFSRANAHDLLHSFEAAQLPVFLVWFALAGIKLDLQQLWIAIVPVLIIVVARAAAFYLGAKLGTIGVTQPGIAKYAWVGLLPQAGLSLAFIVLLQKTFPTFGGAAAVIVLSVLGVNQLLSPVLLRRSLLRSGEAGQKASRDFATRAETSPPPPP